MLNRKVQWDKLCSSKHIWGMFTFITLSISFMNYQISLQDYMIVKLVILDVLFLLMIYCIQSTIRSDPGRVPLVWDFGKNQSKKYCLLCQNFKPERSHHCSTCGRCVLNMDHHCPWLSNCIGFYNRKTFILSVFYGWIQLVYGICLSIPRVLEYKQFNLEDYLTFLVPLTMVCGMLVLVSIFFKFHLILILNNLTTIEHLEKKRSIFPDNEPNKYDIGVMKNMKQVLGKDPLLWLVPTISNNQLSADGIIWPRISEPTPNFLVQGEYHGNFGNDKILNDISGISRLQDSTEVPGLGQIIVFPSMKQDNQSFQPFQSRPESKYIPSQFQGHTITNEFQNQAAFNQKHQKQQHY